jgi:hypothetical protein
VGGTLDHPAMLVGLDAIGSLVLDIEGPRLDMIFLRADGSIGDSFTIIKGPPAMPEQLHPAAVAAGAVTLAWTDRSLNESGFTLQRCLGTAAACDAAPSLFGDDAELAADATVHIDSTVAAGETYGYRIRAFNVGGVSPWSNTAEVTVPMAEYSAPSNLDARATSTSEVRLVWNPVAGATLYEVSRRGAGGVFAVAGTSATSSFLDGGLTPSKAYLYRVRVIEPWPSQHSLPDVATTFTFSTNPLHPGVIIKAAHIMRLRAAVNEVRALAGQTPAFSGGVTAGTIIVAAHIVSLRVALEEALTALGVTDTVPGEGLVPGETVVRAVHVQELRDRVM